MLYDVDIEASACVLSSRYAMLCYAKLNNMRDELLHGRSVGPLAADDAHRPPVVRSQTRWLRKLHSKLQRPQQRVQWLSAVAVVCPSVI